MAGKRAGLDGARSGLWFEFQRIVSELRPRYVLVENVPGLLSSSDGRDFGTVVTGLGELGYAVSWAVLDSQHFGVPQRRRRVFIVAGPDPESTEAILSIREGCGGHPETRGAAGQDVAGEAGIGLAKSLRARANDSHREESSTYIPEVAVPLSFGTRGGHAAGRGDGCDTYIAHALTADGFDASEDGTGRGTPLVSIRTAQTSSNGWGIDESDTAYTLDSANGQAIAGAAVRRLTPVECARLQGFPDDWLDGADGPQYRALGNAVTTFVVQYIGERIIAVDSEMQKMRGRASAD